MSSVFFSYLLASFFPKTSWLDDISLPLSLSLCGLFCGNIWWRSYNWFNIWLLNVVTQWHPNSQRITSQLLNDTGGGMEKSVNLSGPSFCLPHVTAVIFNRGKAVNVNKRGRVYFTQPWISGSDQCIWLLLKQLLWHTKNQPVLHNWADIKSSILVDSFSQRKTTQRPSRVQSH